MRDKGSIQLQKSRRVRQGPRSADPAQPAARGGVPIGDMVLLEEMEEREDLKAARAALREVKRKGTISLDEVLKFKR